MAQSYNHLMLPLADARDRYTQILWGLKEFHQRFGNYPEGMWLPECGIDRETVRALIDHNVKFVILSPHQASKARPFGEAKWREASMGGIDTRRAYRLFETDGAGRTHFDRWLNVVFYTPGLNLKVSFDHILNRPDDLARELADCYDPNRSEAQLVSIVTDGEIYGHHEKGGQEALTHLFKKIAPSLGVKVTSTGDFLRDNPPTWEVLLWDGEDDNGSSWSCEHGMGRWSRDCGCTPSQRSGWNQAWRRPLRDAFDLLRDRIREISRRELGNLVWDRDEARNDYIRIILDRGPDSRQAFLNRHSQRNLGVDELRTLWRILEADRHAMLMYTSCGWFFDELSGLEPVQNMRYALRAAELAQPYSQIDLVAELKDKLSLAHSNLPRYKHGGDVFTRLALTSRYSDQELAAAMAMCLAIGLPPDSLSWKVVRKSPIRRREIGERCLAWGTIVCHDQSLDRFIETAWLADISSLESAGVILHEFGEVQVDRALNDAAPDSGPEPDAGWAREMTGLSPAQLHDHIMAEGVAASAMPADLRQALYRLFAADKENAFMERAALLGKEATALFKLGSSYGSEAPDMVRASTVLSVERGIEEAVNDAIAARRFDDEQLAAALSIRKTAEELDFWASQNKPSRALAFTMREIIHWLEHIPQPGWLEGRSEFPLADGECWVAPADPVNSRLAYPQAGSFALALGKHLARWRRSLMVSPHPAADSLNELQIPEILAFARRGSFIIPEDAGLTSAFWDFLGQPLARLISDDPTGLMAGEAGDKLRDAGRELGFSETSIDKRLVEAAHLALSQSP